MSMERSPLIEQSLLSFTDIPEQELAYFQQQLVWKSVITFCSIAGTRASMSFFANKAC